jgi:ribosomal protein L44E
MLALVRRNGHRRRRWTIRTTTTAFGILFNPFLEAAVGIPTAEHFLIGNEAMQHRQDGQFKHRHEHASHKVTQNKNGQARSGKRVQRQLHVRRHEIIGTVYHYKKKRKALNVRSIALTIQQIPSMTFPHLQGRRQGRNQHLANP